MLNTPLPSAPARALCAQHDLIVQFWQSCVFGVHRKYSVVRTLQDRNSRVTGNRGRRSRAEQRGACARRCAVNVRTLIKHTFRNNVPNAHIKRKYQKGRQEATEYLHIQSLEWLSTGLWQVAAVHLDLYEQTCLQKIPCLSSPSKAKAEVKQHHIPNIRYKFSVKFHN